MDAFLATPIAGFITGRRAREALLYDVRALRLEIGSTAHGIAAGDPVRLTIRLIAAHRSTPTASPAPLLENSLKPSSPRLARRNFSLAAASAVLGRLHHDRRQDR